MPALALNDRKIVHVDGADAEHFLQTLVTANVETLEPGTARPAALLTPQGKILFDFLLSKSESGGYECDVRADIADDFIRRLTLYKLRAAVTIEKREDMPVIAGWNGARPDAALIDKRFPDSAGAWRLYGSGAVLDAERSEWEALRIANGVAESGADFALSDVFPHDVLMDKNNGVDFRKGCYVGQEVVSRMHHRGTARRRVATLTAESDLPATATTGPGPDILAADKPVGSLGSVVGNTALAIVRTDRVVDALADDIPLTVAGVPVTLSLPEWTGLAFTSDAANTTDA